MKATRLVTVVMLLGLSLAVSRVPASANNGLISQVVPVDSVAYGRTYGDWSAAWWEWSFSIPALVHPIFDNGPCTEGQSGPVFFLGGKACANGDTTCNASVAVRNCTIPAGKAIFFPIVNVEDSAPEEIATGNPSFTINSMRQLVQDGTNGAAGLKVDLDGKSLDNLKTKFLVTSVAFEYTLPANNELQALGLAIPAGTYSPAVDDGVYVMLKPLATGHHLLHFAAGFPSSGFAFDITYRLTIAL